MQEHRDVLRAIRDAHAVQIHDRDAAVVKEHVRGRVLTMRRYQFDVGGRQRPKLLEQIEEQGAVRRMSRGRLGQHVRKFEKLDSLPGRLDQGRLEVCAVQGRQPPGRASHRWQRFLQRPVREGGGEGFPRRLAHQQDVLVRKKAERLGNRIRSAREAAS